MASVKASMHWCVCMMWRNRLSLCRTLLHQKLPKDLEKLAAFLQQWLDFKNEQLHPEPNRKYQKCKCTLIYHQITLLMLWGWNLCWLKHQVMERYYVSNCHGGSISRQKQVAAKHDSKSQNDSLGANTSRNHCQMATKRLNIPMNWWRIGLQWCGVLLRNRVCCCWII